MKSSIFKVQPSFAISVTVLFATLFTGFASASSVAVCAAPAGCLPDFNVTGGTVSYTTNTGSGNGGILSITGAKAGNISFALDGVLNYLGNSFAANVYDIGGNYISGDDRINGTEGAIDNGDQSNSEGQLGFGFVIDALVGAFGGTNNMFSLTMDIDANGNVTSGAISLAGSILDGIYGGTLNNGIPDGVDDYAQTANGVALNGLLLLGSFTGSQLGGISFDSANNKVSLGFIGGSVSGGILNEYSPSFAGSGSLSNLSIGGLNTNDYLDNSWTAGSYQLDVVVPIPAAGILFMTSLGLLGLSSKARYQR